MTFPFFGGWTEEQMKQIAAEHDKRVMSEEAFLHDFQRVFDEMPLDHLQVVRKILSMSCGDEHIGTYYEGMIVGTMKYRFGICMAHGVNHDEEILEMTDTPQNPTQGDTPLPLFDEPTDADLHNMEVYHLDDLRDEDTNELLGFICTGIQGMKEPCGMRYPSIEDRMLRGPEECSGCFVRMGNG